MSETSWMPDRKIGTGFTVGGALAFITVWILSANGIVVPDGGEAAFTVLYVSLVSYLVPNGKT